MKLKMIVILLFFFGKSFYLCIIVAKKLILIIEFNSLSWLAEVFAQTNFQVSQLVRKRPRCWVTTTSQQIWKWDKRNCLGKFLSIYDKLIIVYKSVYHKHLRWNLSNI